MGNGRSHRGRRPAPALALALLFGAAAPVGAHGRRPRPGPRNRTSGWSAAGGTSTPSCAPRHLLPEEPEPPVRGEAATPPLPRDPPGPQPGGHRPLPAAVEPAAPLSLPTGADLQRGSIQGLSLEQALALAFRNSAELQGQREQVAAALADLQAALGTFWPRISAVASGGSSQGSTSAIAPVGNTNLGFGPQFSTNGLANAQGQPTGGAFTCPAAAAPT